MEDEGAAHCFERGSARASGTDDDCEPCERDDANG